jgi:hypothetical protein
VPIHVRVWLTSPPRGAWLGSQARIYIYRYIYIYIYNRPKTGSWHSTHGRVYLIGTRAQPDSLARLVRVWAPLQIKLTYALSQSMTVNELIFTKAALVQLFCHSTNRLVADTSHRQTVEQSPYIYLVKGLTFTYGRIIDITGTWSVKIIKRSLIHDTLTEHSTRMS